MSQSPPHLRLRKHLGGVVPPPVWPPGLSPIRLDVIDPRQAHAVLDAAFPGLIAPYADWHGNLLGDEEYDPALCIAAVNADRRVVGFIQSWTSNFIKDLAVAPDWRRRGVGSALMLHTFALFSARGAASVDLKVMENEPNARRLYARLGMVEIA